MSLFKRMNVIVGIGSAVLALFLIGLTTARAEAPQATDGPMVGGLSTLYVATNGNNANACTGPGVPCLTIAGAIGKASAGSTIIIATGKYTENLTATVALTFIGAGADATIIDGGGVGRVLTMTSGSIYSLTVRNGAVVGGSNNGGGIYASGALTLTSVNVVSNTAGQYGGGLYVGGAATITGSQFMSNTAGSQGGGLLAVGPATITGTQLIRNSAGRGGGLYFNGYNFGVVGLRLTNVLLAANSAITDGAALYLYSTASQGGVATIVHTTIASPTVGSAQAIFVGKPASYAVGVNLTNTIVASYTTGISLTPGVVITADYNLFYKAPTTMITGSHSISGSDPLFVNAALGNYHLAAGSPAIDAGANTGVGVDLDGAIRPQGAAYDIGAYEAIPPILVTYVDPAGSDANACDASGAANACRTIGAAIGKTAANGTINIAAGIYTENLTATKALTFIGAGADSTIISGGGVGRVLNMTSGSIYSLTVRNGYVSGYTNGGGIYATGVLTLTAVNVTSNYADGNGGGIYAKGALTLTAVNVTSNTAGNYGGGLFANKAAIITGSQFISNTATNYSGGGVYVGIAATIAGTQFMSNTTGDSGGGLYASGAATIAGSQFTNNAAQYGGGLAVGGAAAITGTQFMSNIAGQWGGGLYAGDAVTITGTQFMSNTAGSQGGGLFA